MFHPAVALVLLLWTYGPVTIPLLWNLQALSDTELVECWRSHAGSPEAEACLNELFGRYHTRVAAWCYRFTGERTAASDLAQDVFLKAYRHLGSFEGSSKFSTWLFMIARNHCFNDRKARNARPEQGLDTLTVEPADRTQEDALSMLVSGESRRQARALMNDVLDDKEREIMALHFGEGLRLDSINRLLGLTNSSGARAYIVSAKRKLSAAITRMKKAGNI